jgi:YVTN family beta-propeller protein
MLGDHVFIVVNNSGKVVVMDKNSMEHAGAVKDLVSPRAVHFVNNKKAYISDMLARRITIFNPGTLAVTGHIPVSDGKPNGTGHATENFVQVGNYVYVTCWVSDNKVLVIDTSNDAVVDSITVPYQPNKMLVDAFSKIWIQTDGEYFSTTGNPEKPALVRIDPMTRKVEKTFRLNQSNTWFTDIRMTPDKDSILFMAGDLYKMSVKSDQLPDKSFMSLAGKAFYSFGIDPVNGELYMGDAIDYASNGVVYRFTPKGTPLDTFTVGVCPGDFLFKY